MHLSMCVLFVMANVIGVFAQDTEIRIRVSASAPRAVIEGVETVGRGRWSSLMFMEAQSG
jgi:hypothetical protein